MILKNSISEHRDYEKTNVSENEVPVDCSVLRWGKQKKNVALSDTTYDPHTYHTKLSASQAIRSSPILTYVDTAIFEKSGRLQEIRDSESKNYESGYQGTKLEDELKRGNKEQRAEKQNQAESRVVVRKSNTNSTRVHAFLGKRSVCPRPPFHPTLAAAWGLQN